MITIFTDGSSRGNPGPGGWGSVMIVSNPIHPERSHVTELGGTEKNTTNNKMELKACIEGLKKTAQNIEQSISKSKDENKITINTDSSYVINGITKWIHGWKKNGWMTKTKDNVSNKDVWIELDDALAAVGVKNVSWKYVGGHVGIVGNERCDVIATSYADGVPVALYDGAFSSYTIPNILDVSHDTVKAGSKKKSSSHSKAQAYSYISSVGGVIQTHTTWSECEKRVKGTKGAHFKKSLNAADERSIIAEFKCK